MPIYKIYVIDRDELNKTSAIRKETLYLLEGDINPEKFVELFVNPRVQVYSGKPILTDDQGPVFEIRYEKAIIDPELDSLFAAAYALDETNLEWGRIARRYQFPGMKYETAFEILKQKFFNPVVHEIVTGSDPVTIKPIGAPDPMEYIELRDLSDEQLLELSRENSWNAPLVQLQAMRSYSLMCARPLTDAESELFVALRSDHCDHWYWKALGLIQRLREATKRMNHPLVISALEKGPGIIDFDRDIAVIIKGETHNYPFAILPKAAVETGEGGAIRDVLTAGKGGEPICATTVIATATKETNPSHCIDPDILVREAIAGIADYGNPMGIPVAHAIYKRHEGYIKPFSLSHVLGVIPKKYAKAEEPKPGDLAVLIGGRTGRDGLHGATGSSGANTYQDKDKSSASVQIGHPITERKFMEAIPELRDAECIRTLDDLGAAGLGGAAGELGKDGVVLMLQQVPLKDVGLSPYEILLSESQERMLLVIPPEKLRKAKRILEKYDVLNTAVGKFTNSGKFEAYWKKQKVIDLEKDFLWGDYFVEVPVEEPSPTTTPLPFFVRRGIDLHDLLQQTKETLSSYNISDKSFALFQFDKTVQGRTVIEPLGGKTGKAPLHIALHIPNRKNPNRGLLTTIAFNPKWADCLDPETYAERHFIEAVSWAAAAGADPHAIFLCSNFYTQKPNPQVSWHLQKMVNKLAELTEEYGMPVINGKDSSSGTFIDADFKETNVPPTIALLAAGIVPNIDKVITQDLKQDGSAVILARPVGRLKGFFTNLHQIYRRDDNPILSAAVIGEGGLLRTLFEMCYGGQMGMTLDLWKFGDMPREKILFEDCLLLPARHPSWHTASFVFEVQGTADLAKLHKDLGLPEMIVLGKTHAEKQFFVYNTGTHSMRWNLDELTIAFITPSPNPPSYLKREGARGDVKEIL